MRSLISLLVIGIALTGCGVFSSEEGSSLQVTSAAVAVATPTIETGGTSTAISSPAVAVEDSPTPLATTTAEPRAAVSPIALEQARATTAAELVDIMPPLRDPIGLAYAYLGLETIAATPQPIADLEPGVVENFFISNVDSNTVSVVEAELKSVGENAYFWFDRGDGSVEPDEAALAAVTEAFDEIFDALFPYFGTPEEAGERVHIVHASPSRLCDVPDQCGLAGYFSSRDELPAFVDPQSNERKMFVMNAQQFGRSTYLDTLSHELRHYLGSAYDRGDEDWFVEGAAMLAENLVGYTFLPQYRAAQFLANPDQQLNSWQEANTGPRYGQGYLVNRYLYDRLGSELYREFTMSRWPGLLGVDDVAAVHGLDITGEGLWLDWLASMALLDVPETPENYRWSGPDLEPAAMTSVGELENIRATVHQYAADYYELPAGAMTLEFVGGPIVSLSGTAAPSGDYLWYAQRANNSNPRLTRAVDLRTTSPSATSPSSTADATLRYRVFADTEEGYDFAYVSVSVDGGRTWRGLVAEGMQGLDPADDPSDSALTDRFYTGRAGRWIDETIDLSPYSGQEILLRFEVVTDLILTYGGLALDDIAIPEIGFFDDAESLDPGWVAEGFSRATADLPQSWRPLLITFDAEGNPSVELLSVSDDGRLLHPYESSPGARRPILIVAAVAPETLQEAEYTFSVGSQ